MFNLTIVSAGYWTTTGTSIGGNVGIRNNAFIASLTIGNSSTVGNDCSLIITKYTSATTYQNRNCSGFS